MPTRSPAIPSVRFIEALSTDSPTSGLREWERLWVVETLPVLSSGGGGDPQCFRVLDAFNDQVQAQPLAQAENGFEKDSVAGNGFAEERLVGFHDVEDRLAKVTDGGIAGAVVVEGDAGAFLAQLVQTGGTWVSTTAHCAPGAQVFAGRRSMAKAVNVADI